MNNKGKAETPMNELLLDAAREVVRTRDSLILDGMRMPLRLSLVIDRLRDAAEAEGKAHQFSLAAAKD
jgi:hypothetical protein